MVSNINIKALNENAMLPTRGTPESAGLDLYAATSTSIQSGHTVMIPTAIAMEIPNGFFGAIYPRSGLATKRGLRLANCVAVIDADYRGEVGIPLHNDSDELQIINKGDRIAQLVIQPFMKVDPVFVDKFDNENTERGAGGFGHTGTN